MGGVDLFDMFRALYNLHHRSKRWYIRIFTWIMATASINGWLLYREHCNFFKEHKNNELALAFFPSAIADELITDLNTPNQRKRGASSLDNSCLRGNTCKKASSRPTIDTKWNTA